MRIPITVFTFCILSSFAAKAQPSLTLATGLSTDINGSNSAEKFRHIPLSFEYQLTSSRSGFGLLLKAQYFIPFNSVNTADAYTLNPSLPAHVQLQETVRPDIFTAGFGFRVPLFALKDKSRFYLDLFAVCLSSQNMHVNYQAFDNANYDVQNPDFSKNTTGWSVSAGITYKKPVTKNSKDCLVFAVNFQSAPSAKQSGYPNNFGFVAPLSFTVGYNFNFKKRK